jgi:hypothetical protein
VRAANVDRRRRAPPVCDGAQGRRSSPSSNRRTLLFPTSAAAAARGQSKQPCSAAPSHSPTRASTACTASSTSRRSGRAQRPRSSCTTGSPSTSGGTMRVRLRGTSVTAQGRGDASSSFAGTGGEKVFSYAHLLNSCASALDGPSVCALDARQHDHVQPSCDDRPDRKLAADARKPTLARDDARRRRPTQKNHRKKNARTTQSSPAGHATTPCASTATIATATASPTPPTASTSTALATWSTT